MNDSNSSWDGFFSQVRQLHQHVLEIAVFFAGLTEPGPLHIGKDLIHMLQLPPQLVIFRFQFQDGFFQCGPFGSGICGFLCGKDGFFVFRVNYQRLKKGHRGIWRLKVKNPNQTSSKSMRTVPEYRDHTGPPGFAEKPICRASPLCEGCPFPGHGFLCQGGDGECIPSMEWPLI